MYHLPSTIIADRPDVRTALLHPPLPGGEASMVEQRSQGSRMPLGDALMAGLVHARPMPEEADTQHSLE